MTVAGIMVLSLGFAAPAQAMTLPPGAPAVLEDVRQAVPSSVLESLASDPDQKGYNAKFANITKYYGGSSAADARKERFRVPIQGAKKLAVQGANGATALMGTQFVQGVTTSGLSSAVGIDVNNAVCSGLDSKNLSFVGIVFGYDCADALAVDVNFSPNAGQPVTYTGNQLTGVAGSFNGASTTVDIKYLGYLTYWEGGYQYADICSRITKNGEAPTTTAHAAGVVARFASGYQTAQGYSTSFFTGTARCSAVAGSNAYQKQGSKVASPGNGFSVGELDGGVVAFGPYAAVVPLTAEVANPTRNFECTLTMTDGTKVSAKSAGFTEKDTTFPVPSCPALPAGKVAADMTVTEVGGGETKTVSSGPTTAGYQDWATKFPQCADGSCQLDLQKLTNGVAVSCFSSPEACTSWMDDPAKADNFQCTYAGTVVALTECNIYGPTFKPGALTTGNTYGDPKTGQAPSTPSTTPQDFALYNSGVQDSSSKRQCFPKGYDAMNPVQWVMQPVQCAMEWAFVPTSSKVKAKMVEADQAWANTPMAKIRPIMTAWGGMWPSLDGCQGPRVSFRFMDMGGDYYPLDACTAPLDSVAAASRTIGAVGMYFGACLAITRYLGASFGYTGLGSGKGQ